MSLTATAKMRRVRPTESPSVSLKEIKSMADELTAALKLKFKGELDSETDKSLLDVENGIASLRVRSARNSQMKLPTRPAAPGTFSDPD